MPFTDNTSIIVEHSINKGLTLFELNDNIIATNIDNDLNIIDSKIIINGKYSFIDICLDIDSNDNIYGILNDKKGKLQNINIKDNSVNIDNIIKYDFINFIIKFTYIKKISNESHIVYYSINKKIPNSAYLIHIYQSNNIYKKSRIDYIDYNILTNFVITYNNNTPTIFYFKHVNYTEELFTSTFDKNSYTWSKPVQITNSQKGKIYLSVIKDNKDIYHIVFSENNNNKFFCKYINGNIKDNNFIFKNERYINKHTMCVFPNLIFYNTTLYIQWVEYFDLYTCQSSDYGKSWSKPAIYHDVSNLNFQRYEFRSNNNIFNTSTIFALKNTSIIL